MIKSLSNISDITVIDQNNANNLESFTKIEFDDEPLGSGGFGTVHKVKAIDGIQSKDYVVKIFTDENNKQHAYDVIHLLHDKLKKRQLKSQIPIYSDLPELLGLPFAGFNAYNSIEETHVIAFLMYDLNILGYEDYGSDNMSSKAYNELSLPDKIYLAYQLAKIIDTLHDFEFIHSDIKEASIWFEPKRVQLALIDFDSGYHFDKQDKPTTIGAVGHWISGKLRNIIGQSNNSIKLSTLDRLYEEYWILANAIFEIIFGVMPFFFLVDSDDKTKQQYLSDFTWPHIDYNSELFNSANRLQHDLILNMLEKLNQNGLDKLVNDFTIIFNKGYKNNFKRLTSKEWRNNLYELNSDLDNQPIVSTFSSNKNVIHKKDEVITFNFDCRKYNAIYLNNELVPLNETKEYKIKIQDSAKVTIKAINDFSTIEEVLSIDAVKLDPIIKTFSTSNRLRDSLEPIILKWNTENTSYVTISSSPEKQLVNGSLKVEPTTKTIYSLSAYGHFGQVAKKEVEVDIIQPKIINFSWEINLNEGIDNIDLYWQTENCEEVIISPKVGIQDVSGRVHVPINKETTFTIFAKGLFQNVSSEIIAHPFPVPIITQLFVETPKIELNAKIDFTEFIPINSIVNININNLDDEVLKKSVEVPDFETNNLLIDKYSKPQTSITEILNIIKSKIKNQT